MKLDSVVSLITNSSSVLFSSVQARPDQFMKTMQEIVNDGYRLESSLLPFSSLYYYSENYFDEEILDKYGHDELTFIENFYKDRGEFPNTDNMTVREMISDEYAREYGEQSYYDFYDYGYVEWYMVVDSNGNINRELTRVLNNIFEEVEIGEG